MISDINLPNGWMTLEANTALVPSGSMGIKEETICDGFARLNIMQHSDLKDECA